MMDSHLRPYFSSSVAQLDFDATLFAKALGANDPPLAKRIFVEMSILPSTICRKWSITFRLASRDHTNIIMQVLLPILRCHTCRVSFTGLGCIFIRRYAPNGVYVHKLCLRQRNIQASHSCFVLVWRCSRAVEAPYWGLKAESARSPSCPRFLHNVYRQPETPWLNCQCRRN